MLLVLKSFLSLYNLGQNKFECPKKTALPTPFPFYFFICHFHIFNQCQFSWPVPLITMLLIAFRTVLKHNILFLSKTYLSTSKKNFCYSVLYMALILFFSPGTTAVKFILCSVEEKSSEERLRSVAA